MAASAPQISASIWGMGNRTAFQEAHGAFYKTGEITGSGRAERYDNSCTRGVAYEASRSSSIYGASDTVRPLSRKCRFIIKY